MALEKTSCYYKKIMIPNPTLTFTFWFRCRRAASTELILFTLFILFSLIILALLWPLFGMLLGFLLNVVSSSFSQSKFLFILAAKLKPLLTVLLLILLTNFCWLIRLEDIGLLSAWLLLDSSLSSCWFRWGRLDLSRMVSTQPSVSRPSSPSSSLLESLSVGWPAPPLAFHSR